MSSSYVETESFVQLEKFNNDLLQASCLAMKNLTESAGVILYSLNEETGEIVLIDDSGSEEHKIKWNSNNSDTVAEYVAQKREYVHIDDIFEDGRFDIVDIWQGPTVTGVLCFPIISLDGKCSRIIELFKENGQIFEKTHVEMIKNQIYWMGISLARNEHYDILIQQQRKNMALLGLTNSFVKNKIPLENALAEIELLIKDTVQVERATLAIVTEKQNKYLMQEISEKAQRSEYKKIMENSIIYAVVKMNQLINIKNIGDVKFEIKYDLDNFITRTVLCNPIESRDSVLGFIQLQNKLSSSAFTCQDEEIIKHFSVYASIILIHNENVQSLKKQEGLTKLFREMFYNQINKRILIPEIIPIDEPQVPLGFNSYFWYPENDDKEQLVHFAYHIFKTISNKYFPNKENLYNFLYCLQRCYHHHPYHNFEHGFTALHYLYNIMLKCDNYFTELEKIGMLISVLCHDLDHPGFTMKYLTIIQHPIMIVYDKPELENHHFQVTFRLIEYTGVLSHLSSEEYKEILHYINVGILATNLERHFECKSILDTLTRTHSFDWKNENHRSLIRELLMTAADFSGQTKQFKEAKRITNLLFEELENEKKKLITIGHDSEECTNWLDEQTRPETQINFLKNLCIPAFELLKNILPELEDLYDACQYLCNVLTETMDLKEHKIWCPTESIFNPYL